MIVDGWLMDRLLAIKMTKVPMLMTASSVENEVIQNLCSMENVGRWEIVVG